MAPHDYRLIRKTAFAYRRAGLSVLPVQLGGGKGPYSTLLPFDDAQSHSRWKPLQEKRATAEYMKSMFPGTVPQGIGIIGGAVSGGLEIFDFEHRRAWKRFRKIVNQQQPGLLDRLPQVRTPRDEGGRHLYVWSDHAEQGTALTRDAEGGLLIETRGEANYAIAPGSDARCHVTRRPYIHDDTTPPITEMPRVTFEERAILFDAARSLNRYVPEVTDNGTPTPLKNPNSPGNIYSRTETFAEVGLLEKHGWEQLDDYNGRVAWRRPGKDTPGFSALSGGTPDRHGRDVLNVFSTNGAPLVAEFTDSDGNRHSTGRPYTLFAAYTALECKGNYSRAAMRLAKQGYTAEEHPESVVQAPNDDGLRDDERVDDDKAGGLTRSSRVLLWQPFPVHILPAPLDAFIKNISETIGADPGFFIGPVLAELAGAVGNSRRVRLKDGWTEPSVIWAAFLATSGMLKSPTMDHATKHLRQIQAQMFRDYKESRNEYELELRDYEEAIRARRRLKSDQRGDMPEPPQRPICGRILVDDVTVEALIERLGQNPRGVLLATDELAGWVSGMNQYKGGRGSDVQHWLKMHGAREILYDRKGQEPVFVPNAAVSVTGPVPPGPFKRVMGQEHFEDGLVPRLLITMPPETAKIWTEQRVSASVDRRMASLVKKLVDLEMATRVGERPVPVLVDFTPDAHVLWKEWYNFHAKRQMQVDDLLKAAYAKLEGYCARFALLFHLVRHVRKETGDEIDLESMQIAIGVAEWFVHETARVYMILLANAEDQDLISLAEWVHRHGGETSATKLHRRGPKKFRKDAAEWLDRLVEIGWAKTAVQKQSRGRPTTIYRVRCALSASFSANTELVRPNDFSKSESASHRDSNDEIEVRI